MQRFDGDFAAYTAFSSSSGTRSPVRRTSPGAKTDLTVGAAPNHALAHLQFSAGQQPSAPTASTEALHRSRHRPLGLKQRRQPLLVGAGAAQLLLQLGSTGERQLHLATQVGLEPCFNGALLPLREGGKTETYRPQQSTPPRAVAPAARWCEASRGSVAATPLTAPADDDWRRGALQ